MLLEDAWLTRRAEVSLGRLLPRLENRFAAEVDRGEWDIFSQRLRAHFPRLFTLLHRLYGQHYDFFFHLEELLSRVTCCWIDRNVRLKALDASRELDSQWFQSNRLVGAMCYVDLFAGDLVSLRKRIPYLAELGVTYLHLMPLFKCPAGDNDGGYAISSYREVDPRLGTMEDLRAVAEDLRTRGISLVLDFVFNHTADEHEWALKALAGEEDFQEYYRMFPDRTEPDAYEASIMAIFPDDHPGCFTYRSKIRKWVWSSFNNFQWDLNYENPAVFTSMAEEMLFLANAGVEVLRLDAVAFLWKEKGTACQNLPEAHYLIQAFNAITQIAAPAVLLKSEAIVHPDEVAKYIGRNECQLSYNPQLMALLWEALATSSCRLLHHAMIKRFSVPEGCAWVNYVRCHDDIGWTFSDDDSAELGINGRDHRKFLNDFFVGRFAGSYARGLLFQEDLSTGDARVSGTTASLCGLEKALEDGDQEEIKLAIRRITLLHAVIITIGGIPVVYLGDAVGFLNDYGYRNDPAKSGDNRWVHRPEFDWHKAEERFDPESVTGSIFHAIMQLVQLRQQHQAFSGGDTEIIDAHNDAVFGYFRHYEHQTVLCLGNFSADEQTVAGSRLRLLGMRRSFTDLLSGRTITATQSLVMEPYEFMVLVSMS